MWRRTLLAYGGVAATAGALTACGGGSDNNHGDIVQVAQSTAELSILVEAVVAAGLVETLKGAGPFTVFAPTNAAFASLLTELGVTKEQLLANRALLTQVLTFHVLAGKVEREQIPLGRAIKPVQGATLKIEAVGTGLVITDGRNRTSNITATNIQASNGVVHLIDKVLLPPNQNIVQKAQSVPALSILVEAVVAANLQGTLSGPGPFTVFAPTDAAFAALLGELGVTKAQLLANTALLTKVLTYHVLPGQVLKAEIPLNTDIRSVQGDTLRIGADLAITDQRSRRSNITATDIFTTNGVVHTIDRVILPRP